MQTIQRTILSLFLSTIINVVFLHAQNGKVDIFGYSELDHFSFFEQDEYTINTRNQSTVLLNFKSSTSEKTTLFSSIEFRNDLSDNSRNRIYLKESYIDFRHKSLDTRVGKQIIQWGVGDGVSPMRSFTPRDYSDILDTENETLAIFALYSQLHINSWTFHAVFSPIFTPSIVPSQNSRWQMKLPSSLPIQGNLFNAAYNIERAHIPSNKFNNSSYAVKIDTRFNSFDISAAFSSGYNVIPEINIETKSISHDTVYLSIQPFFYRHQVLSANIESLLQKFIVRAEGAIFFPQEIPIDKSYFQYIIGVERIFGKILKDNRLLMNLQWVHEISQKDIEYSHMSFNHLFQKHILTRFELQTNRNMSIIAQGMFSISHNDFYLQPAIVYNIADGINAQLQFDILGGDSKKEGFFTTYSHNNRVQLKLKYNF